MCCHFIWPPNLVLKHFLLLIKKYACDLQVRTFLRNASFPPCMLCAPQRILSDISYYSVHKHVSQRKYLTNRKMTFFLFWILQSKDIPKIFRSHQRSFVQTSFSIQHSVRTNDVLWENMASDFLITRLNWQPSDYVSADNFYKVTPPPPIAPRSCNLWQ